MLVLIIVIAIILVPIVSLSIEKSERHLEMLEVDSQTDAFYPGFHKPAKQDNSPNVASSFANNERQVPVQSKDYSKAITIVKFKKQLYAS